MKRFKYSLENVLHYKEQILDSIKAEHGTLLAQIRKKEAEIQELENKLVSAQNKMDDLKKQDVQIKDICLYGMYISEMEDQIRKKQEQLKLLQQQEEKKKVQTENQERIKTPFSEMVRKFKKQKNAVVALCFIIFLIFLAFFGSKIVPYGINEYDYNAILQGPSMKHLFGTDEFGRDLFSRIVCGTRISLAVGFGAVTVGAVCGTILGLLAGYYGGWIDSIIMRICDVLFAFPGLILAIAIVAILGSGMTNVVIAVAVFSTSTFARLVRSKTLSLKNSVFVLAARNIGVSDARILFHHILPGAIPDIIVQYSMSFGSSILTASSLSFLGMGAQPPTPEWGLLLSNGRNYMTSAMYVTIFPGLAIFLTVLSFNLLGDGLRDALDPKLSD